MDDKILAVFDAWVEEANSAVGVGVAHKERTEAVYAVAFGELSGLRIRGRSPWIGSDLEHVGLQTGAPLIHASEERAGESGVALDRKMLGRICARNCNIVIT